MILLLAIKDALFERTLLNFTIAAIISLILIFSVFGKGKYVNQTAEMKKTAVIICSIILFIFICLYLFSIFG